MDKDNAVVNKYTLLRTMKVITQDGDLEKVLRKEKEDYFNCGNMLQHGYHKTISVSTGKLRK